MRVVFVGQSTSFSWPSLHAIAEEHEVVAIVESVPNGLKAQQSLVKRAGKRALRGILNRPWLDQYAAERGIPYLRIRRAEMPVFAELLRGTRPDVACIASMAQLLPPELLRIPRLGFLNFHPSQLPAYRGPCPWVWQVVAGEGIGATIHRVDVGEDTGPILRQGEPTSIDDVRDVEDLVGRVSAIGAVLYREVLRDLAAGREVECAQPRQSPTPRARTPKAEDRLIDWQTWSMERVALTLRLISRWHNELPSAGRGRRWKVIDCVCGEFDIPPAEVKKVRGEWRLGHREGYIRLQKVWTGR